MDDNNITNIKDLFLSYSHADIHFVSGLAHACELRGISVWLDDDNLLVGDNLIPKIQHAIDRTRFFAPVVSINSVNSEWVKKELEQALVSEITSNLIKVLPIVLGKVDTLPGFLRGKICANFSGWPNDHKQYDISLMHLVQSVLQRRKLKEASTQLCDRLIKGSSNDDFRPSNKKIEDTLICTSEDFVHIFGTNEEPKPTIQSNPKPTNNKHIITPFQREKADSLSNTDLAITLCKKIIEDFKFSVIHNREYVEKDIENVKNELINAGLPFKGKKDVRFIKDNLFKHLPHSESTVIEFTNEKPWPLYMEAWKGSENIREKAIEYANSMATIKFNSATFHPSVEATLLQMKKNGLKIEVDSHSRHGIDQVSIIENNQIEYEFILLVDANIFLLGDKRCYDYRFLMPVYRQPHVLIKNKSTSTIKQLFVAKGSSAEHQCKLQIDLENYKELILCDISELPDIVSNLINGQAVLAWEPLGSIFASGNDYKTKATNGFKLSTSLYCNKKLCPGGIPLPAVGAFVEAFITSWNYCYKFPEAMAMEMANNEKFLNSWKRVLTE